MADLIFIADDPGIPEGRTEDPFAGLSEAVVAELQHAFDERQWGDVAVREKPAARQTTHDDLEFVKEFWQRFGGVWVNTIRAKIDREYQAHRFKGSFIGFFEGTVPPADWKPYLLPHDSPQPINAIIAQKNVTVDTKLGRVRVTFGGDPQKMGHGEALWWAPGAAPTLLYSIRWQLDAATWDKLSPLGEGKAVGTAVHGQIAMRDLVVRNQGAFPSTHRSRIRLASTNAVRAIGPVQEATRQALYNLLGRWFAGGRNAPTYHDVRLESASLLHRAYEQMREIGRSASGIDRHGPGVDPRLLREEEDWYRGAVREELGYWNVFLEEVHQNQVPRDRMVERINAYIEAMRFVYESARILALPDNVLLYWTGPGPVEANRRGQVNPPDAHPGDICEGCDYLMERSPFPKDRIPAVPKDGSTVCLTNCRHKLVVRVVNTINEVANRATVLPTRATMVAELRRIKEDRHSPWRRARAKDLARQHRGHPELHKVANPFKGQPMPPPKQPFSVRQALPGFPFAR